MAEGVEHIGRPKERLRGGPCSTSVFALTLITLAASPPFLFPAAEADDRVAVDLSAETARVDGLMTDVRSSGQPVFHRVDARRSLLVEYRTATRLYDVVAHTFTPIEHVDALQANEVLVLLRGVSGEREACDVDRARPALRCYDRHHDWLHPLTASPHRVVLASRDEVRIARPGAPTTVLPFPRGWQLPPLLDIVRDDRLLLVRSDLPPGDNFGDFTQPWCWSLEVGVLNLATGALTSLGKTPGQWSPVVMNCCSGWRPVMTVSFISAAEARAGRAGVAVLDEGTRLLASRDLDGGWPACVAPKRP